MRTHSDSQRLARALESFEAREREEESDHEPGPVGEGFRDLFAGSADESAEEGAVRHEVAGAVLAELLAEGGDDEIAQLNTAYAARLYAEGRRPGRVSRTGSVAA